MVEVVSEFVEATPTARLVPHVMSYNGYRLSGFEPGVHAGLPSSSLTLIIAFDEPLDLAAVPDPTQGPGRYTTMLAGLHTSPAKVRHQGRQHGIQVELTPRGAMALFGVRPADMVERIESVDQFDGPFARRLVDRLEHATDWQARFDVLDDMLAARLGDESGFGPRLDTAWQLLVRSGGRIAIADLAADIDWSRRHLSEQFRRTFGLSPKALGNVVRFERAQRLLRHVVRPSLAEVAAMCGYADQAHMTRQWHGYAGSSPTTWLADERLPFVQDDGALALSG